MAAVLLPAGAGAQKVTNPGVFSLSATGGQIKIGDILDLRLTPNPMPECSDGVDNDADNAIDLTDAQCAAGPEGQPAGDDNSELVAGFQPMVDVSIVGTVDAAGKISIPASGIVFPPSYVPLKHPVDGSKAVVQVDILATGPATGVVDPNNGKLDLTVGLRAKLSGNLWGSRLPSSCSVGTAANPITIPLTTGRVPAVGDAGPLGGSPYNPNTGRAVVVNNSFVVPGASGCLINGWLDLNPIINDAMKLPSVAGKNMAVLAGMTTPALGAAVIAKLGSTPSVLVGDAPFNVQFNSSGSSVVKGPATYAWDFGDGGTSAAANPSHSFAAAGFYTVKLTVSDADGDAVSQTTQVAVTGGPVEPVVPVAKIVTDPVVASGDAPLVVGFDGSSSVVDEGPGSFEWDFGDGSSASGVSVSHTYTDAGSYTATLTVTDTTGDVDSVSVGVRVTEPVVEPPASDDTVSVAFNGSVSYSNNGSGTGNMKIVRDAFGLNSVTGYLDVDGTAGGTARVKVTIHRVWILPLWAGDIQVSDPGAKLNVSTPVFGGVSIASSPSTAGSTLSWFKVGSFPNLIRPYTLKWSVIDAG